MENINGHKKQAFSVVKGKDDIIYKINGIGNGNTFDIKETSMHNVNGTKRKFLVKKRSYKIKGLNLKTILNEINQKSKEQPRKIRLQNILPIMHTRTHISHPQQLNHNNIPKPKPSLKNIIISIVKESNSIGKSPVKISGLKPIFKTNIDKKLKFKKQKTDKEISKKQKSTKKSTKKLTQKVIKKEQSKKKTSKKHTKKHRKDIK